MSGKCELCYQDVNVRTITRHMKKCASNYKGDIENMLFRVCAWRENTMYWLFLLVPTNMKLKALDEYLRKTWLECCGHLSEFEINGKTYMTGEMNKLIKNTFVVSKENTRYTYDFGSSTELCINALSICQTNNKDIKLLSRNDKPIINCCYPRCKKASTIICNLCQDTFCDKCIGLSKHACEFEMDEDVVVIVNSPRYGICGYDGNL